MVTSRFLMTLLSLILALLTQPCRSAEIPAGQVDAIAQEALKAWQVPGAAVAIVRGDEVIYVKGHGVRELGKPFLRTEFAMAQALVCSRARDQRLAEVAGGEPAQVHSFGAGSVIAGASAPPSTWNTFPVTQPAAGDAR